MKNNGRMDYTLGDSAVSMIVPEKMAAEEKATAVRTFNESVDKATASFNANLEKELEASRKIKEEAQNLEILPTGNNVLFRMYDKNPWEQIKVTDAGLIIPAYDGMIKSHETGEKERQSPAVIYGEVLAVGPEVLYIKEGDDIIARPNCSNPAPFLGQPLWIIGQHNVLAVINEGLTERYKNILKK